MKKTEIVILSSIIFSIILSSYLIFFNKYDKLIDDVIRIHILANSNSKEDQILKYQVKDNISSKIFELLSGAKTKENARNIILNNLDYISEISKNVIIDNGYCYDADVSLTKSYFLTRRYDDFVLPAGKYDALKVVIGEGRGKNWWCVAFPPMCSPIYNNKSDDEEILGYDQLKMIENPCEYKFAIVELITNIKKMISNNI